MDYKNYNDYELVYQVRENDKVAYDVLMKKYSKLVDKYANYYYLKNKNIGIEIEDLYQEGMLGVVMALNDYNSNDTLFYTYALLCIRREMERLVKASKRKKHMILNDSISLNSSVSYDDDLYLEEVIPSSYNVEESFFTEELSRMLISLKNVFDNEDSMIYELKYNCFSNKEISVLLELPYKYVDNRLRKIRKIIKHYILKTGY